MFYLVEGIIYGAFLMIDGVYPQGWIFSDMLKYAGLILCVARSSACIVPAGEAGRRFRLLKALLWLAAGADIFLLSGRYLPAGLLLFAGVQCCYGALWIRRMRTVLRFCAVSFAAGVALYLTGNTPETVLAGMYAALLLQNTAAIGRFAGKGTVRVKGRKAVGNVPGELAWAIVLLLLCDIHVGAYNLLEPFTTSMRAGELRFYRWVGIAMWFFYLPSMVFVVRAVESASKK